MADTAELSKSEPASQPVRGPFGALVMAGMHISAALIFLTMLAISGNAISRYVFDAPLHLVTELSGFVFLFMIFLAAAGTFLRGGHIAVELLIDLLPPVARLLIRDILMNLIGLFYVSLLVWAGVVATLSAYETGARSVGTMPVPFWPVLAIIPFGAALLFIAILSTLLRHLRGAPQFFGGEQ